MTEPSAGQRQLLALALVVDPAVLFLDEAIDAIDSVSEGNVPVLFFPANAHRVRRPVPGYKQRHAQRLLKPCDSSAFLSSIDPVVGAGA